MLHQSTINDAVEVNDVVVRMLREYKKQITFSVEPTPLVRDWFAPAVYIEISPPIQLVEQQQQQHQEQQEQLQHHYRRIYPTKFTGGLNYTILREEENPDVFVKLNNLRSNIIESIYRLIRKGAETVIPHRPLWQTIADTMVDTPRDVITPPFAGTLFISVARGIHPQVLLPKSTMILSVAKVTLTKPCTDSPVVYVNFGKLICEIKPPPPPAAAAPPMEDDDNDEEDDGGYDCCGYDRQVNPSNIIEQESLTSLSSPPIIIHDHDENDDCDSDEENRDPKRQRHTLYVSPKLHRLLMSQRNNVDVSAMYGSTRTTN